MTKGRLLLSRDGFFFFYVVSINVVVLATIQVHTYKRKRRGTSDCKYDGITKKYKRTRREFRKVMRKNKDIWPIKSNVT